MQKIFFTIFIINIMNNIAFTSRIYPVKIDDFKKRLSVFGRECLVDYPWDIKSSKVGQNVYTMKVDDCTFCLISDGSKALLMHLNPANKENHNFKNVYKFISEKIDLKNPDLQAVVAGSKICDESSVDIFDKFVSLLQKIKIPTTILRDGGGETHIAYRTSNDEVLITNCEIDSAINKGLKGKDVLDAGFKYVKISEFDEIV